MAHLAGAVPGALFDPALLGVAAYLPMQPPPHAAAAAAAAPAPAAHHASSGGGGSSKKDSGDTPVKKGRKPYTITKPRESWTKEEHQLFLDALAMYERDWKRIGAHIPTKSIIQIRSHAQKYFIKMAKMGLKEYIPAPARPKRAPGQAKPSGSSKSSSSGGAGGAGGGGSARKRQKTSAARHEEGEDDEEEQDAEEDEGQDDEGQEGDEGAEGEHDAAMHDADHSPNSKAARSLHGLASMLGGDGGSARKKPSPGARPGGGGSARKMPPLRRGESGDGGDDDAAVGTRRSGRKRVQKRKFDDEEYDEDAMDEDALDDDDSSQQHQLHQHQQQHEEQEDEEDEADDSQHMHPPPRRRNATGKVGPGKLQQQQYSEEGGHVDPEGHGAAHGVVPGQGPYALGRPPISSSPSTPLRKDPGAVGQPPGPLNQLSQLSPLSQLTQASSLEHIGTQLLPASMYNPKLKPYPGLHMRSTAGLGGPPMHPHPSAAVRGAGLPPHLAGRGVGGEHPAGTLSTTAAAGLAINTAAGDESDAAAVASGISMVDPAAAAAAAAHAQAAHPDAVPEFAKVYSFLGSLFDPSTTGHIEELEKMTPVNKEIVQKLMQNLATNLSSSPTQASNSTSSLGSSELLGVGYGAGGGVPPLGSALGSGSRLPLLGAPKHMRTSSLGSIGSLDALSPDMSLHHRWLDQQPSVSPTPAAAGGSVLAALTGPPLTTAAAGSSGVPPAHGSPTSSHSFLPRSFSTEGLTVSVIPPGPASSAVAGLTGAVAPNSGSGGHAWSADKSRPGFASSALVSRITARGALSPLSVAPLSSSSNGVGAAPSPTGSGGFGGSYTFAMSPTGIGGGVGGLGTTPLGGFGGSPGGLFSMPPAATAAAAASSTAPAASTGSVGAGEPLPQYPQIKPEGAVANTLAVPPASVTHRAAGSSILSLSSTSSVAPSLSPVPPALSPLAPTSSAAASAPLPPAQSGPPTQVSPTDAGILAMLHSSPPPPAAPAAATAAGTASATAT